MCAQAEARLLNQDPPHERIPIGMEAGRAKRNDDIRIRDQLRTEQTISLDHTGRGAGQVVLIRLEDSGMLGGPAAEECATRRDTTARDAADDSGDPLWVDPAARNVVGQE